MNFKNRLLEQAVRELLAAPRHEWISVEGTKEKKQVEILGVDTTGRSLNEEDLSFVTGIHIWTKITNAVGIPWHGDCSGFNQKMPNLFITWEMLDWDDLKHFGHIKHLYVFEQTLEGSLDLALFPNLTQLYLVEARVKTWAALEQMTELCMLSVDACIATDNSDFLPHVGALHRWQRERLKAAKGICKMIELMKINYLDHLAAKRMGISDISPVKWAPWTDVNLSHNDIEDISPMKSCNVYYLTLRHNKIKNVEPLRKNNCYLLNLRHNKVSDIMPIIEAVENGGGSLARLFLNHNPIPKEQLERLASGENSFFVDDDFMRCEYKGGVREDFTYEGDNAMNNQTATLTDKEKRGLLIEMYYSDKGCLELYKRGHAKRAKKTFDEIQRRLGDRDYSTLTKEELRNVAEEIKIAALNDENFLDNKDPTDEESQKRETWEESITEPMLAFSDMLIIRTQGACRRLYPDNWLNACTPEFVVEYFCLKALNETELGDEPKEPSDEAIKNKTESIAKLLDEDRAGGERRQQTAKQESVDRGIMAGKRTGGGPIFDFVLGPACTGKSGIANSISQMHSGCLIDIDFAKEILPYYNNGYGANAVHEDSCVIMWLQMERAISQREYIVHPARGLWLGVNEDGTSKEDGLLRFVEDLKAEGYTVNLHVVELSREKALGRLLERFDRDDHWQEPYLVDECYNSDGSSKCTENARFLVERGLADSFALYDNDVPEGSPPIIKECTDPEFKQKFENYYAERNK